MRETRYEGLFCVQRLLNLGDKLSRRYSRETAPPRTTLFEYRLLLVLETSAVVELKSITCNVAFGQPTVL